ncbi:ribosomal biogenesis protein LAS1L-like [Macrosteles quadrilineatus]|uniref:ribosomal biogenesis protein LAS1L-like n=1 Tax=Macrosteles quadrilineatus TaxID=74068 RepID=UPI0023E2288D|nr:ribosomal biogenesis protein LAS1L-like [Macrosteles quadrilineatus]
MIRPNSPSSMSLTKLQIVPWFSKEEWLDTYSNAYSSSFHLREKAYTQMCIWKARFPNLPMGVECTMSTLHVKLCDKPEDNTYQDRDLQLLYSTAVMRFLNQLTVLSDRKDSMYKMAELYQLPDWIINLRHEAAHGNSVPALYLLRQAADIILQWLEENYWKVEEEVMKDVIKNPEQDKIRICSNIKNVLDLWVTLKTQYWSELRTIDQIGDANIRDIIIELP